MHKENVDFWISSLVAWAAIMATPQKTVNIRMPTSMAEDFDRLAHAIPGLHRGAIMRMLLQDQFSKPLQEQVGIVTKQLLSPDVPKASKSRIGANTKNRVLGEQ
jgi:hypothetical protein